MGFNRTDRLAIASSLASRDEGTRHAIMRLVLEQYRDDGSTVIEPEVFDGCIYDDGTPARVRHDASGVDEADVEATTAASLASTSPVDSQGDPLPLDWRLR